MKYILIWILAFSVTGATLNGCIIDQNNVTEKQRLENCIKGNWEFNTDDDGTHYFTFYNGGEARRVQYESGSPIEIEYSVWFVFKKTLRYDKEDYKIEFVDDLLFLGYWQEDTKLYDWIMLKKTTFNIDALAGLAEEDNIWYIGEP